MVSKVHSCRGLDAFSQIDTSVSFCGDITHLGLPFCLVYPQGTVLGPILFLIYINDIARNIMSNSKLFEDDMKVYRVLRNTKEDAEELQKDLTRLESWSNEWQLRFNTDKCKAMRISKKNDYSSPQYHLCGNQLKAVSEVKDLGIYITSNLSWSMQANKCANKANSVLGFIRRTVGPKNPEFFFKLYKSLVRPILIGVLLSSLVPTL